MFIIHCRDCIWINFNNGIMSKYYTPSLEEFHVGFEMEGRCNNEETQGEWFEMSIDQHTKFWKDYDYRVKYLDQEDIESLGFVKWPDDDIYDLGEFQLYLGRHVEPYKVEIYDDNSQYCFVGTIKNKSELKRVLRQIGYETK